MSKASVAILNYNGAQYLETFLPTFIKFTQNHEIVIIDNASTDESVSWLKENYPEIRCIVLETNLGFAGGYNQGLKEIESEYFAIVNSDIEVSENWLDIMVRFLDENQDYVACQPKIKSYHNKEYFEYAGACGGFIDGFGYPYCRGRIFEDIEKDEGQYDDIIDIFWASGACMLIRAKDFFDIGGFDKDFFAHMEEIDMCWRLSSTGKKIACIPDSVVYHVGGGTLAKSNPMKTYLNFRNGLSLLLKNLAWYDLWKIYFRMTFDLLAGVKFWIDNDHRHFIAVLHAHVSFIKRIFLNTGKRIQIKTRPVKKELIHSQLLIADYFIRGRRTFKELRKT